MKRPVFLAAAASAFCMAFVGWRLFKGPTVEDFSEPNVTPPEAAPLCPWREPQSDLNTYFPGATTYQAETRILSGQRMELARRLGRQATGDENALRLNRVYRNNEMTGTILTRRIKGEFGGIEIVLATDNQRAVRGLRLQRLREPEPGATALQDTNWLNAFSGKRAADAWQLGHDIPAVPPGAHISAAAIVEGVRDLLVLQEVAEQSQTPKLAASHH